MEKNNRFKSTCEIALKVTSFVEKLHKDNANLANQIVELQDIQERKIDNIFTDLLSVLDSFEKANKRMEERFPQDENVANACKRFATPKKRLLEILKKNGISEMSFSDDMATLDDCQIIDTEPDLSKLPNTIVSIEKPGFRRNGRLLRLSEVIVVKN